METMRERLSGWWNMKRRGSSSRVDVDGCEHVGGRGRLSRRGRRMLARLSVRLIASIAVVTIAIGTAGVFFSGITPHLSDAFLRHFAPWTEVKTPAWLLDPDTATGYERSVAETFHETVLNVKADCIRNYVASCVEFGMDEYPTMPDNAEITAMVQAAQAYQANHPGSSADDAAWATLKDLTDDEELVERLYPVAQEATGFDASELVVATWTLPDNSAVTYQAYSDGRVECRDYTLYYIALTLLSVAVPVGVAAVFVAVVVLNMRQPVRAYDALFQAVQSVLADPAAPVELPRGLEEDERTLARIADRAQADRRAAGEAEVRKNELVAYLAHDIKTPLTSVSGYLSLIEESPEMPAEQLAAYAHRALDRTYRLDAMLDELFEISRFNLGRIVIEREHLDLALFCHQVADELAFQGTARGVTIAVTAPEDVVVFVDAEKLSRALANILKNAVAYADEGSEVALVAETEDEPVVGEMPRGRAFAITVTDHGREIASEHLERIFERFFRADDARGTSTGGAGLGLAIAREIVRAHGGDITATSERGVTTFTLRIPGEHADGDHMV